MTKKEHLLAIKLLEKLGLRYLLLEPDANGSYRYHAWNTPLVADNGSPLISKHGRTKARLPRDLEH